jgi:electron transfer flavoprotein alpha subunit
VDQNPEAPIFEIADIGIVGNLQTIVPLLIKELKGEAQSASAGSDIALPP